MGSKRLFILIVLLIAGGFGLYYFQSSGDNTEADQSNSQANINTDTIPAADQPTFTAQPDTHDTVKQHDTIRQDTVPTPPPVGEDFAPGTALVRGTITSVDYTDDEPTGVQLQVDEVMGYGPSTPPLPTGTELTLEVANFLKAQPGRRDEIQKDREIKVVISSRRGMRRSDDIRQWTLVEFQ